jgi:hypothetical protein
VGGALALDAAWLFAAFLVLLVLAAAGIAGRRFLLERGGGTVECGLRKGTGPWRLGVAAYHREELYWFGVFRVSMRPEEIFPQHELTVISRRLPSEGEAASLGPGMIVVECRFGAAGSTVELALAESALTGLLSWLEASPPGSHLGISSSGLAPLWPPASGAPAPVNFGRGRWGVGCGYQPEVLGPL